MPLQFARSVPFAAVLLAAGCTAAVAQRAPAPPTGPDTCATAPALCPALAAAQKNPPLDAKPLYPGSALQVLYQLPAVANGIATSPDGRAFVIFPRLEGKPGVRLAEVHAGNRLTPFPDQAWNSVPTAATMAHRFVRLNALRFGPEGRLWVIDTGARTFADPPAPGGAKILVFDIHAAKLVRTYPLEALLTKKSYVDDIRFGAGEQKGLAYLTDAGDPALIVLNLKTGKGRRVLQNAVSTTDERPMVAEDKVMRKPNGEAVKVHADQLEVSPDGQFFYFEPSSGPIYRIETKYLADPSLTDAALEKHVTLFANTPTTGGTAIDASGNLYMSDVGHDRVLKISPSGAESVLVADPRLVWCDAMWIDARGNLLMPAAQMNRTAPLNGGKDAVQLPVTVYSLAIHATPEVQGQVR